MNNYKKPRSEIIDGLIEQLKFLKSSARNFDEGDISEAKRMALAIRVLVYDTRSCTSIFRHLKIKQTTGFVDTTYPYDPLNLVSHMSLVGLHFQNEDVRFTWRPDAQQKIVFFDNWWNEPVIVDSAKRMFSRFDIINFTANKENGAHFDGEIPENWAALTRFSSVGWLKISPDGKSIPMKGIELYCLRQMAFEMILTIERLIQKGTIKPIE